MRVLACKLYDICRNCGQMVRIDKPILGSMHFCLTDDEMRDQGIRAEAAQRYRVNNARLMHVPPSASEIIGKTGG